MGIVACTAALGEEPGGSLGEWSGEAPGVFH
jgi:hypothetical protein